MGGVKTVLILGSAPDVLRARDWPRSGLDRIVAINHAWAVRTDWDDLIHPSDFPAERRPAALRPGQRLRSADDYVPAINAVGGFVFSGGTMAFTAGYWALLVLRPRLIAFLGCDMVYPETGPSHFYGRGSADPLRADPTLQSLEAKSARFQVFAAEAGCAVVNLSDQRTSRLVFPRAEARALPGWAAADSRGRCADLLTQDTAAGAARARAAENALGYEIASGKYWKEIDRFDPAALHAIDELWLATARSYSVAA